MIPILSAEQMRSADAHSIAHEPISALELMERAASRCAEHMLIHLARDRSPSHAPRPFLIMAGMGNNGGDGAVIARILHQRGHSVRLLLVRHREQPSPELAIVLERCAEAGVPMQDWDLRVPDLHPHPHEVIIDALVGTGLNAEPAGLVAEAIIAVNASGGPVFSVDMPSGLRCEENAHQHSGAIVRAMRTFTFEVPKLALLLPENASFVGHWECVPIGLHQPFIAALPVLHYQVDPHRLRDLLPVRPTVSHKGTFGHALLVAGSKGRMGAAVLCTQAALRSGCGLVSALVPRLEMPLVQSGAPEAMCIEQDELDAAMKPASAPRFSAIGCGPGLGSGPDTAHMLKRLIQDATVPLVLDADALNILGENPTWLAFLRPGTILTPHPKEFDRLRGKPSLSGYERLQAARAMAVRTGCIVVLKGAPTATCAPDGKVFFNCSGNSGMAKGGTGDVLTGLLTGLLAQGLAPLAAAMLGVYLHGSAGDHAAARIGMDGMTAGDLVGSLPAAWQELRTL